jgi:hypothetical protein
MQEERRERSLELTMEEAMGLLDILLLCPGELTAEQRTATLKLSEFCRKWLRDSHGPGSPHPHVPSAV